MRSLRGTGLIALAVTLVALLAASTASAEEGGNPFILPEPTSSSPLRFISKVVETKIAFTNANLTIECQAGTSTGEFTSKRAGVITMSATNCVSIAHTLCHTVGAEKGTIKFPAGTIHLVAFKKSGTLRLGAAISIPSVFSVNCETGTFEWRGSVIGVYEIPAETFVKTATWIFGSIGETANQTECDLDKEFCLVGETHKKFRLEVFNGTEFVAQEMKRKELVEFEKEAKFFF